MYISNSFIIDYKCTMFMFWSHYLIFPSVYTEGSFQQQKWTRYFHNKGEVYPLCKLISLIFLPQWSIKTTHYNCTVLNCRAGKIFCTAEMQSSRTPMLKKDAARTLDRMHCVQRSRKIVKAKLDAVRNLRKIVEELSRRTEPKDLCRPIRCSETGGC